MRFLFTFFLFLISIRSSSYAITYYFSGNLLSSLGSYAAGTTYNGSFSYNYPQVTNIFQGPAMPAEGRYVGSVMDLSIGSDHVTLLNSGNYENISIKNIVPTNTPSVGLYDNFSITFNNLSGTDVYLGGALFKSIDILLIDIYGNALSNLELVNDQMRLGNFSSSLVRIDVRGNWNSLTMMYDTQRDESGLTSLVPEPSSLSLLLAGGAVLMAGRRRKV